MQSKTDKKTVVLEEVQDQIQSAYWHQKQSIVLPSALWSNGEPESYAIVSDSSEHDKRSVLDIQETYPAMRVGL